MNNLSRSRSLAALITLLVLSGCSKDGSLPVQNDQADASKSQRPGQDIAQKIPALDPALPVEVIADSYCSIDSPKPDSTHDRSAALPVWGWAFDRVTGSVPAEVSVRITATDSAVTSTTVLQRGPRPDVAAAFRLAGIENSGFGGEINLASLTAGTYKATILQKIGGSLYSCSNGSTFTLQ